LLQSNFSSNLFSSEQVIVHRDGIASQLISNINHESMRLPPLTLIDEDVLEFSFLQKLLGGVKLPEFMAHLEELVIVDHKDVDQVQMILVLVSKASKLYFL
jgi:hypothetical protein